MTRDANQEHADHFAAQQAADAAGDAERFPSSFERFEILLTLDDAESGSHQGRCDDDVAALARVPYVAEQLAALDAERVRAELAEYGAWDAEQLADHAENLQRVLWLACCDIREEN